MSAARRVKSRRSRSPLWITQCQYRWPLYSLRKYGFTPFQAEPRHADKEKKKILDLPLRANAEAYVDFYEQVLNEQFVNFKSRFFPYTKGRIGFIGALNIQSRTLVAYAFAAIGENEEKVRFVPITGTFFNIDTNILFLMGAKQVHYSGSTHGFNNFNIKKEILEKEIPEQLETIMKNGRLNEENNYYLSLEKVLGIILSRQRAIHGIKDSGKLSGYLPITIERIEYGCRYERAIRHFEETLKTEKIQSGAIIPTRRGPFISYAYSFSAEERKNIHEQAQKAATEKRELPSEIIYRDLDKLEEELGESLFVIKKRTFSINETIAPDEDAIPIGSGPWWKCFKMETLTSFIFRVYCLFLNEYKDIIEMNFPNLKKHFSLYSNMPVQDFMVIGGENKRNESLGVRIYKCKKWDSGKNEIILCKENDIIFDWKTFTLYYQSEEFKVFLVKDSALDSFMGFNKYGGIGSGWGSNVLRSLVYQEIRSELSEVVKELKEIYKL